MAFIGILGFQSKWRNLNMFFRFILGSFVNYRDGAVIIFVKVFGKSPAICSGLALVVMSQSFGFYMQH